MAIKKILCISFLLFIRCGAASVSDTLEDWQDNQKDNDFWYGTAIIQKANQENIQEVARNAAINEIASQIRIKIKQDFNRTVKEDNYKITEHSIQTLNTQIDNNLEDVEVLQFKDFKNQYILQARLSKNKYYASVKRKRENATKLALKYIENLSSPSLESFKALSNAKDAISPYMDYPIYVEYNNREENLYSLIEVMINNMLKKISINPEPLKIEIKNLLNEESVTVKVVSRDSSDPIPRIPLFSKLNDKIEYCFTDNNGECELYIKKENLSKELMQYLYIGLDKSKLYKTEFDSTSFDAKIDISLLPINIFLDIEEYNLNNIVSHSYIEPAVKEFLVKEFNVNFTKNVARSDLLIDIKAETRANNKKANEYGIYQVFCDASINVKFLNSEDSILKLNATSKGADFNSLEQAGHKALEEVSKTIFNETLVDLVSILKEN